MLLFEEIQYFQPTNKLSEVAEGYKAAGNPISSHGVWNRLTNCLKDWIHFGG